MRQNLPLDVKILMTKARIREWYNEYCGDVYVSFSGGKDSTVLLDLVRSVYPDVKAVYIDTGLEYVEVRDFVKTIDNVIWLKPKMNFKQVVQKYGYPIISKEQAQFIDEYRTTKSENLKRTRWYGNEWKRGKISEKWKFLVDAPFKISHKCCNVMKKNPAKKFEKESGLHPFIGTMAEESALRMSGWVRYGCNAFDKKRPTSQPLSFWREQDILEYIKTRGLNYASCYGDILQDENGKYYNTGCERTGCEFCLFGIQEDGCPSRLERIKEIHPARYKWMMKPIENGGLGIKAVIDWINSHSNLNIRY